jgi:hypothetical protein
MNHTPLRSGTILIIVAGISALMASLALTFLIRARADVEDAELTARDAQARIMLAAACSYIMEASRIGWEPMNPTDPSGNLAPTPVSTEHDEAFGWIDVRDGGLGPRTNTAVIIDADRLSSVDANKNPYPVDNPMNPAIFGIKATGKERFPVNVARRFPMHVLTRPPFAISPKVTENPVKLTAPDNGISYLRYPDPQPAVSNYNEWAKGDTIGLDANGKHIFRVRQDSIGKSWFRILREKSGATFIVTCGAGGTLGYRSWAEVGADQPLFNNEQAYFEALRTSEIRLWYRVEWDAAIAADEMNYLREHEEHSFKVSSMTFDGGGPDRNYSGQWYGPNMGGTIQMIQRLVKEPANW